MTSLMEWIATRPVLVFPLAWAFFWIIVELSEALLNPNERR